MLLCRQTESVDDAHCFEKLGCVREETAIIGDRMDTDILAGVETEMDTVLVLSGVTSPEEIDTYAYRPKIVINDVGDFAR